MTTVRRSLRAPAWEQPFRVELMKALLRLPGARVQPDRPGEVIAVVWDVP